MTTSYCYRCKHQSKVIFLPARCGVEREINYVTGYASTSHFSLPLCREKRTGPHCRDYEPEFDSISMI